MILVRRSLIGNRMISPNTYLIVALFYSILICLDLKKRRVRS